MSEVITDSEKYDILIEAVLEEMITRRFPGGLSFDIPGTDNKAILQVIPDQPEKNNYRFRIEVHRNGYDMLVSKFWEKVVVQEDFTRAAVKGCPFFCLPEFSAFHLLFFATYRILQDIFQNP